MLTGVVVPSYSTCISLVIKQKFFPSKTIRKILLHLKKTKSRFWGVFWDRKAHITAQFHVPDLYICAELETRGDIED